MAGFLKRRKRSCDDDSSSDSAPLAKRINNLHLDYDDENSSSSSTCSIQNINSFTIDIIPPIEGGSGDAIARLDPDDAINEYNPELSADENPYYFEKNKMLYNLHAERVKRTSQ